MRDPNTSKNNLREALRQRRRAVDAQHQNLAALALAESISELPAWTEAQHIALYMPSDGEIGTDTIRDLAMEQGKQMYLPVITEALSLEFARWQIEDPLCPNDYNIPEPPPHVPRIAAAGLDIIFLPLVGWDISGARLGMGGGFYDRTLSGVSGPLLVGLAHTCQQVQDIPVDDWDVGLDFVATDTALHHCR